MQHPIPPTSLHSDCLRNAESVQHHSFAPLLLFVCIQFLSVLINHECVCVCKRVRVYVAAQTIVPVKWGRIKHKEFCRTSAAVYELTSVHQQPKSRQPRPRQSSIYTSTYMNTCVCARSNLVPQLCPNTSLHLECSRVASSWQRSSRGNAFTTSLQHNLASSIFELSSWEISAARCEVKQHRYYLHFNTKKRKKFHTFNAATSHPTK